MTATANSAYTFANWTENGSVVSSLSSYIFTLSSNRSLVANFAVTAVNHNLTLSSSPAAGGSVGGAGTFPAGSSRTVTATANSGYTFANWTENGSVVSSSASYIFTLSSNRSLVANFAVTAVTYSVTLSSSPAAGGSLGGAGTFPAGSSRTVTATANSGYAFANWTENGGVVGSSISYTFTLNAGRNLVATFTPTCTSFSVGPTSANPTPGAGFQGVAITGSPAGCFGGSWTAPGNGSWITVSPTSGSGSNSVTVSWSENTSMSPRLGMAMIAGHSFTVNQRGVPPSFIDNPLAGATVLKAVHFAEMRQAIDTLRTRFSLGAFAWTDGTIVVGVTPVKAVHLAELRTALNAVYAVAGQTAPTYTHITVTGGAAVISAVDIAELRAAILAVW